MQKRVGKRAKICYNINRNQHKRYNKEKGCRNEKDNKRRKEREKKI